VRLRFRTVRGSVPSGANSASSLPRMVPSRPRFGSRSERLAGSTPSASADCRRGTSSPRSSVRINPANAVGHATPTTRSVRTVQPMAPRRPPISWLNTVGSTEERYCLASPGNPNRRTNGRAPGEFHSKRTVCNAAVNRGESDGPLGRGGVSDLSRVARVEFNQSSARAQCVHRSPV
jgi:hypothetical protein